MKYLLQIISAVILYCLGKYFFHDELSPHFIAGGVIIFVSVICIDLAYDICKNWNRLYLLVRCWILSWNDTYIRFSMSYQYRIKINDKYLLVKNSNNGFFQHVGGKYKRLTFTHKILNDFEAKDDLKLPTAGLMKDDLAVFIPAKNAIKFINWFNSNKEREISHWREFYEELIDGKARVLPQNKFPYVNYNFIKSIRTPLIKSEAPGWDCWEILQYDVLDLLPNSDQELELQALLKKGDTDYLKWADNELIQNLGHNHHERKLIYPIGKHTKWVLNLKWSKD